MKPKLLVLELWGLGDVALATPLLRAAVGAYEVTLVAKPFAKELCKELWPEVNVIPLNAPWTAFKGKYRLHRWPWRSLVEVVQEVRAREIDVAVSARWDPRDHLLMWQMDAQRQVGFPRWKTEAFLSDPLPLPDERVHRHEQWRLVGERLGLEIPAREDMPPARRHFRNGTIVVHTGAAQSVRRWPLEHYGEVVRALRGTGRRVTVVCDRDQRAWWLGRGERDVRTPTRIEELVRLMKMASAFAGNDSGPGHVASQIGVPTFSILNNNLPGLFAPVGPKARWVEGKDCPHKPCFDACPFEQPHCLVNMNHDSVRSRMRKFAERQTRSVPQLELWADGGCVAEGDRTLPPPRTVLETPLTPAEPADLIEWCQQAALARRSTALGFADTQVVALRRHSDEFREATDAMDALIPVGWLLDRCLKRLGVATGSRFQVPGFMRQCVLASPAPWKHYFLGGSSAGLEQLKASYLGANPEVRWVGSQPGQFGLEEEARIIEEINLLSPDFIWVGLETPRQQEWVQRNRKQIKRGVILGVELGDDVNVGVGAEGPAWLREWRMNHVYRLGLEAKHLAGRSIKYNSLFLRYLVEAAWRRLLGSRNDTQGCR